MFWGIDPRVLSALPKYGTGGIVGGSTLPSTYVKGSTTAVTTSGATYQTFVTVDSEELTRKVLKAHRELEDYNHL